MGVSRTPEDVITGLGFGVAQLRVLLLAAGIWLADGLEITLVTSVSKVTAAEFNLDDQLKGLLSTLTFGGLAFGCLVGGWAGDIFGRRPPILVAYGGVIGCGIATIFAGNYLALVLLRLGNGFSMGLGMAPSQVMISELTPVTWRMAMVAMRGSLFSTGMIYAGLVCLIDDPSLNHLDWRWCFALGVPPMVALFIGAACFLPESPLYLACVGKDKQAAEIFDSMRRLNKCPGASIEYETISEKEARNTVAPWKPSIRTQIRIIMGPAFIGPTAALVISSVIANLWLYGHTYGEPLLLSSEERSGVGMSAAGQVLFENCFTYIGCGAVFVSGLVFSRRNAMIAFFVPMSVLFATFAWFEGQTQRGWWRQAVFTLSGVGIRLLAKGTFLVVHQVSSEIYPTIALTTGASVTIGMGRLGAIIAPMLFEWCNAWIGSLVAFYYITALLGVFAVVVILLLLPSSVETFRQKAEEEAMAALPLKFVL